MDEIRKPRLDPSDGDGILRYLDALCDAVNGNFEELEARIERLKENENGKENAR